MSYDQFKSRLDRGIVWLDNYGNKVKRPKHLYPYNYDPYVLFQIPNHDEISVESVYSDRLFQWSPDKYNKASLKVFGNVGQYFDNREPEKIETFLSEYYEKEIKLVKVIEYCNQSSGYPCWRFDFIYVGELK